MHPTIGLTSEGRSDPHAWETATLPGLPPQKLTHLEQRSRQLGMSGDAGNRPREPRHAGLALHSPCPLRKLGGALAPCRRMRLRPPAGRLRNPRVEPCANGGMVFLGVSPQEVCADRRPYFLLALQLSRSVTQRGRGSEGVITHQSRCPRLPPPLRRCAKDRYASKDGPVALQAHSTCTGWRQQRLFHHRSPSYGADPRRSRRLRDYRSGASGFLPILQLL
jgi:hypothetical protein